MSEPKGASLNSLVNLLTLHGFRGLTLCLACTLDGIVWVKWLLIRLFIYFFHVLLSLKKFSTVWRFVGSVLSLSCLCLQLRLKMLTLYFPVRNTSCYRITLQIL